MIKKATSKIPLSEARACADDLIAALQSSSTAKTMTANLVEKYTLGARTVILDQALKSLKNRGRQLELDEVAVISLITDFIASPNSQSLDKLIVGLANFSRATLPHRGIGWAIGTIAVQLGSKEDGLAHTQVFAEVGELLRNKNEYLAECLQYIVEAKATKTAFEFWENLARPSIGNLSRPHTISESTASKIVQQLSKLSADQCTVGFPLLISVLLTHADSETREAFYLEPIGRLFRENLLGAAIISETGGCGGAGEQIGEGDRKLLQLIREHLSKRHLESKTSLLETAKTHAEKIRLFEADLYAARTESSRLKRMLDDYKGKIDEMQLRAHRYVSELEEKDIVLAQQQAEMRQLKLEITNQEADQKDRHLEDLQKNLVDPAADVRDLIIKLADPSSRETVELRSVAVAFDFLHRRILGLAKARDERVPRHIIEGTEKI